MRTNGSRKRISFRMKKTVRSNHVGKEVSRNGTNGSSTVSNGKNGTNGTNGTNFFSSGLRQRVDQLMGIMWAGGVNNPMDAIEQCSYLLFLRLLSERDE